MHSVLQVKQFFIINRILLIIHNLLDFRRHLTNLIFFLLNVFNQGLDFHQGSLRIRGRDSVAKVFGNRLVHLVPFLILILNFLLKFRTFLFGYQDVVLQLFALFFVIARFVVLRYTWRNFNFTFHGFALIFQFLKLFLGQSKIHHVRLDKVVLFFDFVFHGSHIFIEHILKVALLVR